MKLNGGRTIEGVLSGFDPFMNLVIDESVARFKNGNIEQIGMVVGCCSSSYRSSSDLYFIS